MSIDITIKHIPGVEELIRHPGTRVWVFSDGDDWFTDEELREIEAEIARARREYRRRQMIAEEARAAASPMTNYWPSRWKETHPCRARPRGRPVRGDDPRRARGVRSPDRPAPPTRERMGSMSDAPKLPIERAREVIATWNADGTWRERNALNLPGEVDDLADALEALIREHETLLVGLSRQLASAEAALLAREGWIDPQRIVDLAKRYTDERHVGWVEISCHDVDPDRFPRWRVLANGDYLAEGATPDEALRKAEAHR